MDEPTAGLDVMARESILESVQRIYGGRRGENNFDQFPYFF